MSNKERFRGKRIQLFPHPECQEDEVFMQFVNKKELEEWSKKTPWKPFSPWKSARYGKPAPDEVYGEIYPAFVKKQELLDAGCILVPIRDDLGRKESKSPLSPLFQRGEFFIRLLPLQREAGRDFI